MAKMKLLSLILVVCILSVSGVTVFADTTVSIAAGSTYSFMNEGPSATNLILSSGAIDYAVFNYDDSVRSQVMNVSNATTINIPYGGRVTITSRAIAITATLNSDISSVKEDNKTFDITKLNERETYFFYNNTEVPHKLLMSLKYVDYVIYDKDLSVYSQQRETRFTDITIPAQGGLKLTARENSIECGTLFEAFTITKSNTPAFKNRRLQFGETFAFKNTSNAPCDLLSNTQPKNYVMYDISGRILDIKYNDKVISTKILAGNSIKITSLSNTLEVAGLYEIFAVDMNDISALRKAVIPVGETYSFENTSNEPAIIMCSSGVRDYAIYENGVLHGCARNDASGSYVIQPNMLIKITSRNSSLDFIAPFEWFAVEKQDVPALQSVYVPRYDTYEFKNISDKSANILSSNYAMDYSLTDSNGNITESKKSFTPSTSIPLPSVPVGATLKITSRNNSLDISAPFEYFTLNKVSEPVYKRALASNDITYIFTNKLQTSGDLLLDTAQKLYAVYDSTGNLQSAAINSSATTISVPAEGKAYITGVAAPEINALYNQFDITVQHMPIFDISTLGTESYVYTNTSDTDVSLYLNAAASRRYSYIMYDSNGEPTASSDNIYATTLEVKADYTAVISSTTTVIVYALQDMFSVVPESAGSIPDRIDFVPGKTYKFTNNGYTNYSLNFFGTSKFDHILYSSTNTIISTAKSGNTAIIVPRDGYAIVTAPKDKHYYWDIPSDITVAPTDTPVYNDTLVSTEESFIIENDTHGMLPIFFTKEKAYEYVLYNSDGSIQSYLANATADSLDIPANSSAKVTSRSPNLLVSTLSDKFTVSKTDSTVFNQIAMLNGNTYKIVNTAQRGHTLFVDTRMYNYVAYNSNGTINSYGVEQKLATIQIPYKGWIIISALESVKVYTLNDTYTSEESPTVYEHIGIAQNQTKVIKNNSARDYKITVYTDVFDYTFLDANGNIKTGDAIAFMNASNKELTIPSNEAVAITSRSSTVTLRMIKEVFTSKDRNYPAVMRVTFYEGEKFSLHNDLTQGHITNILTSGWKVSYKVLSANNTVTETGTESTKSRINITGGGRIDMEVLCPNITVAFIPEAFPRSLFLFVTDTTIRKTDTLIFGNLTVRVHNSSTEERNATVFLAIYNDAGTLVYTQLTPTLLKEGANLIDINDISVPLKHPDDFEIKIMVWEKDTMNELSNFKDIML